MPSWSRRDFLTAGASCFAHVALMSAAMPTTTRRLWAARPGGSVVAQEAWGRLEQVAEGVWTLISTPLQDRTTLCNGGIIAGRNGVLLVESFASNEGAVWMCEQALRLTGRWPTHAVLTHYHGDHSGGILGLEGDGGRADLHLTDATRALLIEGDARQDGGPPPDRVRALSQAELLDPQAQTDLDLGGRRLTVVPREGHTASDVTIELQDPSVVFCGDLVWNDMFPNYVDAIPTRLSTSVRGLRREAETTYVPGHGPVADGPALDRFIAVLDHVEDAGRAAFARGIPAAEAAQDFTLPDSLGEWFLFNPAYFERALLAWEKELRATG